MLEAKISKLTKSAAHIAPSIYICFYWK